MFKTLFWYRLNVCMKFLKAWSPCKYFIIIFSGLQIDFSVNCEISKNFITQCLRNFLIIILMLKQYITLDLFPGGMMRTVCWCRWVRSCWGDWRISKYRYTRNRTALLYMASGRSHASAPSVFFWSTHLRSQRHQHPLSYNIGCRTTLSAGVCQPTICIHSGLA